jgi:DNA (cytosine-5)-methyltransferase 1
MGCVSLFSGCGGLDLGIERAGFRVVLAVDNEPLCAESYKANFPDASFYLGSVTDFVRDLSAGALLDQDEEIELLVGGPPCPPYSKSRFYRKEKPRALRDDLAWETINGYLDTLRLLEPRAFILENVAGLAYKVHGEALKLVLSEAKKAGYSCTWRVINAADYGVPQIRERFVLVGARDGHIDFPPPTHAKAPGSDLLSASLEPWRTAGEAIGDLDTDENADDTGHFAGGQFHDLLCQIPPGDNYLYFTEKRGHPQPRFKWRSRYWSFLLKLSPDLPSWTIQARRSNNMGPFHWRNRILRIDEVKRLQTFPDDWFLAGTVEQQWRQVGNAVPPLLAERIAGAVMEHLSTAAKETRLGRAA